MGEQMAERTHNTDFGEAPPPTRRAHARHRRPLGACGNKERHRRRKKRKPTTRLDPHEHLLFGP
jgi:hypothetical protein